MSMTDAQILAEGRRVFNLERQALEKHWKRWKTIWEPRLSRQCA